jgi:hypothetical protein
MDRPRHTNAVRRLESARSATELTTSMLNATLQLVTIAALVGRTLRAIRTRSNGRD